ncbi:MAG: helix-turn-helix domain-containing protein [Anaerolineaceae bacterium]|nr:helix-turn-helix domain-containing protein [Anaerolineaceae bacterium]
MAKARWIAKLLAIQPSQVYYWHKRWREEGIDGQRTTSAGRPKAADAQYRQILEETMAKEPTELGYAFNVWDAAAYGSSRAGDGDSR